MKKMLAISILVLLIGVSIVPNISGNIGKTNSLKIIDKEIMNEKTQIDKQISSSSLYISHPNKASITSYAFDGTGTKEHATILSNNSANNIYAVFEELKYEMTHHPFSDKTKALKQEFVDILDVNGLIPAGLSKAYMLSLLNPSWLDWVQNNACATNNIVLPSKNIMQSILRNRGEIIQQQIAQNHIAAQKVYPVSSGATGKTRLIQDDSVPSFNDFNGINGGSEEVIPVTYTSTASAMFCSMGSGGAGIIMPLILLPRPRLIAVWAAPDAITSVGNLLSIGGFTAIGAQAGIAVGFTGIGLTFAFPTETLYSFVGYALFTSVSAEVIERFPPNRAPVISDENPPSGSRDIPVSLSKLSFRIEDADGDRMSYTVTTEPDIGSGSGIFKKNGVYSVSVSGLESDRVYRWTVEVTDGKDTTEKQFSFFTEVGPPFDPFDKGWQYRKKITIDHTKVAGDLTNFPMLIGIVDSDLADKAQNDGDDILFMDGAGVAKRLYHEIEKYKSNNGELIAWVNVTDISSSTDTEIYMYYGNPSCDNQEFVEKTWDSHYEAVWHMSDTTTDDKICDSTSNHQDSISKHSDPAYEQTGKIYHGINYDVDDGHDLPDDIQNTADASNGFTFETWVKFDSLNDNANIVAFYKHGMELLRVALRGSDYVIDYITENEAETQQDHVYSTTPLTTGTWYYIVATFNGTDKWIYTNSTNENHSTQLTPLANGVQQNRIGNNYAGGWNCGTHGTIDELRFSLGTGSCRSDEWISTSYTNQNDPSSFLSVGVEESAP